LCTDKKLFTAATLKTTELPTVFTCSNQEERHHDKIPAYMVDVLQSVTGGISHQVESD